MNLYKSDKVRFIVGLVFIFIIYTSYYVFLVENVNLELPSKIKHVIKFSLTIAVYFVGTSHLGKLSDAWMSFIWHVVHIAGLIIITTLGIIDWIFFINLNLRLFANSIQEILISPVLYLAMGLVNRVFNNKASS
jgi:hypothetical protein